MQELNFFAFIPIAAIQNSRPIRSVPTCVMPATEKRTYEKLADDGPYT